MSDVAAHLVNEVCPELPVRRWSVEVRVEHQLDGESMPLPDDPAFQWRVIRSWAESLCPGVALAGTMR